MSKRKAGRQSSQPSLRIGGASAIPTVLRQFGVDPDEVLAEAGIRPEKFDDPDSLITTGARDRLMALCVSKTNCQHFGLLVGQQMNLQTLGLVGVHVRTLPDAGSALRSLEKYMHLHSQGTRLELRVDGDLAFLTHQESAPGDAVNQIGDAAVAMMVNVMRTLCGPEFKPVEVWLAHRKPADIQAYRRFFQVPLWFDARHFALVFSRDWLDARLPEHDAELQRLLQKQISTSETSHRVDFPDQVRSILRSTILTDRCTADQISALFSISSRTLTRRLEASGVGYQQLVDECRFDIARRLLKETALDISSIAGSLGYARASVFIRAFRRWSGTTPAQWRATHTGEM